MKQQTVWMAFDLGVSGDYDSLYEWLDKRGAVECGDTFAKLKVKYKRDLAEELRASLKRSGVSVGNRGRIYIIYTRDGEARGKWLFGQRRRAAWAGYAPDAKGGGEES